MGGRKEGHVAKNVPDEASYLHLCFWGSEKNDCLVKEKGRLQDVDSLVYFSHKAGDLRFCTSSGRDVSLFGLYLSLAFAEDDWQGKSFKQR